MNMIKNIDKTAFDSAYMISFQSIVQKPAPKILVKIPFCTLWHEVTLLYLDPWLKTFSLNINLSAFPKVAEFANFSPIQHYKAIVMRCDF